MHIRGIIRIDVSIVDHMVGYKNIRIGILARKVTFILARRSLAPDIPRYINK